MPLGDPMPIKGVTLMNVPFLLPHPGFFLTSHTRQFIWCVTESLSSCPNATKQTEKGNP